MSVSSTDRIRELANDFEEYERLLKDPVQRHEMQRALVIELRAEVEHLWRYVKATDDRPHIRRL